jgi:prepilin-type N-terminal cleavage/methylation domain-containing protein
MKQRGFTVIELLVVIAFLIFAGVLFVVQKNNLEVAARDDKRKTAINAMYYGLEESFYKQNGYYPMAINEKNLTTVDVALFTDPNEIKLGQTTKKVDDEDISVQSDYRYEPTNCASDKCKSYTLRADLEGEADYVKKSRNN